jgi:CPA2 family monovalent cation:H+ antiporter-2
VAVARFDQPGEAGMEFLADVVILFGAALTASWVLRWLRAPSIIGFLLAGLAIGPSALGLIEQERVSHLAELGLILLLFTIGLELSPEPLVRMGRRLMVAAGLQIGLTVAAVCALALLRTPLPAAAAAVVGVIISLSSTAIVLKQLSDRGETESSGGVVTTGILLIQDIAVIFVMALLPLISPQAGGSTAAVVLRSLVAAGVMVVATVAANYVVPILVNTLFARGGRELMTLFAVVMAALGAWLAHLGGWSPALGACVAGLLLATTDLRHQLYAEITPFRDAFNALFFMAIGMLVDVRGVIDDAPLIGAGVAAILVFKTLFTTSAVLAAGWPLRLALFAGVGLCTVSEFGYVLAIEAEQRGLLSVELVRVLNAWIVGSMLIGALFVPVAGRLSAFVARRLTAGAEAEDVAADSAEGLFNHVIIIGFGLNGQNLARVLRATRIPHCVIEMNRGLARAAREHEAPVVVGDATRMTILRHAALDRARALVVCINDLQATRQIVAQARAARRDLYVLARTRYVAEIDSLYRLGAQLVIPEEFETSIEIFAHVLKEFAIPDNVIQTQIGLVRAGRYAMLRGQPTERAGRSDVMRLLEQTATQTHLLEAGSPFAGRTLRETNLRAATGATVIAIVRAGQPTTNPPADFALQANDVLVLVGAHAQLDAARALLSAN